MKFVAALLAALAVVASAQSVPPCDTTKLLGIVQSPAASRCTKETGYSAVPPAPPTEAQTKKICASAECTQLLKDLDAAAPTECDALGVKVRSALIEPTLKACAASAPSAPPTVKPADKPNDAPADKPAEKPAQNTSC